MNDPSSLNRSVFPALLALTLACGGRAKEEATASATPTPASVVQETAGGADAAAGPETAKITPFGVPECDTYVRQYLACIETKVSGEAKDRLMQAFEANRTKWRALATMREGALALSVVCRAATQKAKEELAVDYGCEF